MNTICDNIVIIQLIVMMLWCLFYFQFTSFEMKRKVLQISSIGNNVAKSKQCQNITLLRHLTTLFQIKAQVNLSGPKIYFTKFGKFQNQ